ncbi:hypothetical protein [Acidovorax sp. sic0104]|uniref:hypothetical protein n=1 Tax=Acidovorax sp. sic0104 TaxID=2854784 RepID=UPI001C48805C|nr:hypothetical protein [Acidovorax sp. sic0104]MBV7542173.1 hypothetical protein [Acidovorax sp. sic0104]
MNITAAAAKPLTPRQMEDAFQGSPRSQVKIEALYASREAMVTELALKGQILPLDIANLDRLGRVRVANDHWRICSPEARKALAADAHHQVRSCAAISSAL